MQRVPALAPHAMVSKSFLLLVFTASSALGLRQQKQGDASNVEASTAVRAERLRERMSPSHVSMTFAAEQTGIDPSVFSLLAEISLRGLDQGKSKQKDGPVGGIDSFVPACEAHVRQVVATMDHMYTDMRLQKALEQECWLERTFPDSAEDGFHSHAACKDFAERLAAARAQEQRTGSTRGYTEFCEDYYVHRSDAAIAGAARSAIRSAREKEEEVEDKVTDSARRVRHWAWWLLMLVLVLIGVCMLGACFAWIRTWLRGSIVVEVVCAKNLKDADPLGFGGSDPYCIVEIPGKPRSRVQTKTIKNNNHPSWNESLTIKGYKPGDSLEFTVMDKDSWPKADDFLGSAVLESTRFSAQGFQGEIELSDADSKRTNAGSITVRVLLHSSGQ